MKKKKNVFTFMDLVDLEESFKKNVKFTYNNIKYSTFLGRDDGSPMVKNQTDYTDAMKYSSFMVNVRKSLGIEQQKEETPVIAPPPVSPVKRIEELGKYISEPKELSDEFLNTLQLKSIFLKDYVQHPNIKLFDFKSFNEDHNENDLKEIIPVLYFQDGSKVNIRYKWNGSYNNDGWYTLQGRGQVGGFLFHTDSKIKKASTLLISEGLKDGINNNIGFKKCDILVADSTSSILDFSLVPDIRQYKKIIFLNDGNVNEKTMLRMVQGDKKSDTKGIREVLKDETELQKFFHKMNYIDYSKMPGGVTDSTDFLESLGFTRAKTLTNALAQLKKVLHEERFINIRNRDLAAQINIRIERAKKNNNIDLVARLTLQKLQLKVSIKDEFDYYVSNLMKTPSNATVLNLDTSKYLTKKTDDIQKLFNRHSHILLGSPTGTGKSELALGHVKDGFRDEDNNMLTTLEVKSLLEDKGKAFIPQNIIDEGLPLLNKNIIIITPLQDITVGMGQHPLFTYVQNGKINDLKADLNAPYICITTDTYENLKSNPKTSTMINERIEQAELIVFDEQHYPRQVKGFRGKVVKAYESLKDYKGKVLYMSGTPIYSEAKHAHPVTAILSRGFMSRIKYFIDPFMSEQETLENMRGHLKNGSILFYCKATKEADYIHNLLMKEGKTVIKITSQVGRDKYLKNGVEINKNELAGIKENIVYVATTKITTGVNLKKLIAIYQHGTAYDPNTFIQLTARLRSDGFYYVIKVKHETNQTDHNENKAINISLMAKKLNIKSLGDSWQDKAFKSYRKKHIELPYDKNTLKDFLNIYRGAFQLIESEGYGKLNQNNDDFEFTVKKGDESTNETITKISSLDESQIKKAYYGLDKNSYIKYFERKLIDWITRYGDIEELNKIYNLSFDYVSMNNPKWEEIKPKLFITDEDQAEKDSKKEEKEKVKDEFTQKLEDKLNDLIPVSKLREYGLSDTNLNKLLEDKRLDKPKYRKIIKSKKTIEAKIISLQFHLIPREIIINTVITLIQEHNGAVTLKMLSDYLEQYEFLTTKTAEAPFKKFLKDFFENEEFFKDELIFKTAIKVNGEFMRDVVTLPQETLKKLKAIKNKKEREKALKIEVEKINELTQKYQTYLELLNAPERHEFYDMNQVYRDSEAIKEEIKTIKELT